MKSIIKIQSFLIVCWLIILSSCAKKSLEGSYYFNWGIRFTDIYQKYEFSENGTFTTEGGGDLGPESYGYGTYLLSKDSLILQYSKEKDPIKSKVFIESIPESKQTDSVTFHFEFYELETEMPITGTVAQYFEDKSKNKGIIAGTDGVCSIRLIKGNKTQTYTIFSLVGHESFELDLVNDSSKIIRIGLAENIGKQVFDKTTRFGVKKISNKVIQFSGGDQLIRYTPRVQN
ncbi:hypothetical protein [Algoriphagus halophilus]|uniref:Lipoprotein n=1 Tax=Algoriphagus halophilus TaxID=226505 RepID=A0A1N6DBQ8_9BACT|nr:hypothetical protein [Algoriphagus halophilus]SIN68187.1 hypothetical protein SAMN05444394_0662 [Algoriphagus halophilus]